MKKILVALAILLVVCVAGLLLTAIDQIEQGTVNEIAQDDSKATYASRIQKSDGRLEWDQPAQAIHDRKVEIIQNHP